MKEAICIDWETLDTKETAVVLSFGAVKFDEESGILIDSKQTITTFEMFLDVQEQLNLGRTVAWATIEWWLKQSQEARDLQVGRKRVSLAYFFEQFLGWVGNEYDRTCTRVWVRGQDFDGSIMNTLARQAGVKLPWAYNAYRDMRFLDDINPENGVKKVGVFHSALDDAIYQAQVVSATVNKISNPRAGY